MVGQYRLLGNLKRRGMLMRQHGVTLIEMMVGLVIIALLAMLAAPSVANWIRDMKIRTTAESISSGLQLARTEALRRNALLRFQLVDTLGSDCVLNTAGPHWIVSRDDVAGKCDGAPSETEGARTVQVHNGNTEGGGQTLISSTETSFTFNGLGQLTSTSGSIDVTDPDGSDSCVSTSGSGKTRCLRINIAPGGGIRMCDPALSSTDTQGC